MNLKNRTWPLFLFAVGVWLLQQQADLPSWTWLAGLGFAAIVLLAWQKSALVGRRWLIGLLLGFVWAGGWAHWRLAEQLPTALEGQDVVVTGVVAGLPQALERGVRFEFDVEQAVAGIPSHISLAWYRGRDEDESLLIPVRAGERWQFTVRLKRPHGNVNPQGFDFEGWLFERGVRATGYVRPKAEPAPLRIDAMVWRPGYGVERVRELIRERFRAVLPTESYPFAGILIALTIGDQQSIDPDLWRVFAKTGITHLISISGLHITMLAGLAYALTSFLWRRQPRLALRVPTPQAAAVAGFVIAFAYALLAGFAVPAQRTLYMLMVVAAALVWRREVATSRVLALALLLVLLRDPWAVLAAGFWLSFGAVGVLFYVGSGRMGNRSWWREWLRSQWAVTLGTLPALLALFQQFSLVSPLANAVAIPLVSFVVTPLALLGAVPGLEFLWSMAHQITAWLMRLMDFLAAQPWAVWQQAAPPFWTVFLALFGGVWLLLPRGVPSRWLGFLLFLPLLTISPDRPGEGEAVVTVLDVGQGLAIHVQTARHDLLFDAGPAFSAEADSGNRLIVPYLRAAGVRQLDTLLISHSDKDHEGGAASILAMLPVRELVSSLPFEHYLSMWPIRQRACASGDHWSWEGVNFAVLHPDSDAEARKTNALSCVLLVEAGGKKVLITSDIEAAQESALVGRRLANLAADVLLVPHHGSRTSSTPEFIAAVGAPDVIFPVGYRNRFGHPKDEVVERYRATGARLHRTDSDGAIRIALSPQGVALSHERDRQRRYWQGQ